MKISSLKNVKQQSLVEESMSQQINDQVMYRCDVIARVKLLECHSKDNFFTGDVEILLEHGISGPVSLSDNLR